MFKAVCLGVQHLDFKGSNGDSITGYTIWFAYDKQKPSIYGKVAAKAFLAPEVYEKMPLVPDDEFIAVFGDDKKLAKVLPINLWEILGGDTQQSGPDDNAE